MVRVVSRADLFKRIPDAILIPSRRKKVAMSTIRKHESRESQSVIGSSRRAMLRNTACGIGGLALQSILAGHADAGAMTPRPSHFKPAAKRVIFLFVEGGPSQPDLFVEKPYITKSHTQKVSPPDAVESRARKYLAMKPIRPNRPRG